MADVYHDRRGHSNHRILLRALCRMHCNGGGLELEDTRMVLQCDRCSDRAFRSQHGCICHRNTRG